MRKHTHRLAGDIYIKTLGTFYEDELAIILGFYNGMVKIEVRGIQFFTYTRLFKLNKSV